MRSDPQLFSGDIEERGERVADVVVPVAVDTAYSYRVPAGLDVWPGDVVAVPLGPRETVGVVWSVGRSAGRSNLKAISGLVDMPSLPEGLRRFLGWVADYTLTPTGMVARMALKSGGDDRPERVAIGVRLAGPPPKRMTPARTRVLAVAADGLLRPKRELAEAAGVSQAVIDALVDEGTLEPLPLPGQLLLKPDPDHVAPSLSDEQRAAAEALVASVRAGGFSATLLEGVTGSGKTEVYFEAVAETLRQGRQVLILMPEIALTGQFLDRFAARFGVRPAEWHSGISGRKRERTFRGLCDGEVQVVAGARSGLFLPYRSLGLIVVDEEHEGAYKQEDGVHYHARDMAVVRGSIEKFPVVLASATPSIETRVNAGRGRYQHVMLPNRFGDRVLPRILPIDLKRQAPERGRWLSPPLLQAMEKTLAQGEQALLFLNRRGYAPLTLCRACGHRFQCPNCSAWLVEHRFVRSLQCHHCGHRERRPDSCPECGTVDALNACGPGVERMAEEVATLFPDARTLVLSSDFPGGTERLRRELAEIAEGRVDIVIGTQLVAKGHNFPGITCVGVVDADLGLASGDPRAAERTFQLLQQVTGRAGRGDRPGTAYLQTHQPDHPVLQALIDGDAERFYAEEIAIRRQAGLPPFGRLAGIVVSGPDRQETEIHARAIARAAVRAEGIAMLGPAEAPIAVVRGRHRFRLLVKGRREDDLQSYLRATMARAPKARGQIRVSIDIDPQSFL